MLIESNKCFAIKDESGKYLLKEVSLFKFKELMSTITSIQDIKIINKELVLHVECPICGDIHIYTYSIKDLLVYNGLIVGGCELLNNPIFYIGSYEKVTRRITTYNEINKNMYAMF
ncbi:hypothetical protein [Clostridium tetani]|uniref:Uncharacterized protein n=1 Tax=Clostridium tetani TaxID=1513 RepID=A0ABY0ESR2_CLOTA|nr:hypothetical protein [Clostridium tetani]CDI48353.1 hypothetical protein BN906_00308 [Clostridium tetani 12124569]KHO40258.1 hypothetical protein OR62_01375 [Clostridium tetani]RXI41054.1 hypothetical protein DP129_02665 [Clostridium tetani]RXI58529.1 hypothetical protein DP131_01175 [Clostridium tetani]RXI73241.1 hypothetical protein DQN76_02660 [Clostridium tetani]